MVPEVRHRYARRFVVTTLVSSLTLLVMAWALVLDKGEKQVVVQQFRKIIKR